ncbi:helix-turn-helix transcriptional regulator [Cohnella sp. REN36]|uniref:helix-turn-helix domain-containing protein n=1 Tax=Cohnella sp. REN36 TaxID=2887347 RepID=UPI001D13FF43|nr:helix-turn-helix transcriptional regulator [Cohnella sp. REN36]
MEGYARIRSIRREMNLSGTEVADKLGISAQFYYDIEKGKKKLSADNAVQLADVFGVSLDYLLGKTDAKERTVRPSISGEALSAREERDIGRKLEAMMNELESDTALAFHGEPMDEEERELMRISLENTLRLSRQMAKKKFTPRKYRQ